MEITKSLYVSNRDDWRTWLEKNHACENEVWLIYYKAHSGQPSIPYDDSLEEALCFGWIDSLIQKIDDEKFARKFTPRRSGSKWSESTKRRVLKMAKAGRMTPVGMAKVDFVMEEVNEQAGPDPEKPEPALSEGLRQTLMANEKTWQIFNRLPPSHQYQYTAWIMDAKKVETRQRRLHEAIAMLEQNKRLGMK